MPTKTAPDTTTVPTFVLTAHARLRMSQRGIRQTDIGTVLRLGRCRHARGARFYFIGRKEVQRYAGKGMDLRSVENLHVLLDPHQDQIITVYRNARLPRG
jgi:hypothetical protein